MAKGERCEESCVSGQQEQQGHGQFENPARGAISDCYLRFAVEGLNLRSRSLLEQLRLKIAVGAIRRFVLRLSSSESLRVKNSTTTLRSTGYGLAENREFSLRRPCPSARPIGRGLAYSSERRFAVPQRGCDRFAPLLFRPRKCKSPKNMTTNLNCSPLKRFTSALLLAVFLLSTACFSKAATVTLGSSQNDQGYFITDSYLKNGVDIGSNTRLEGRTPLFLVHGINAEADQGLLAPGGIGATYSSLHYKWGNFLEFFNSRPELVSKYKTYRFAYRSNEKEISKLAEDFGTLVRQLENQNPELTGKPIVVLAHSMGGLVTREFMLNPQNGVSGVNWGDRVVSLITLGTPHHGTPLNNDSRKVFGALGDKLPLSVAVGSWGLNTTFQLIGGSDWNDPNRSDMLWDNYDSLFTYNFLTMFEDNFGLKLLNIFSQYDSKTIAYAGTIRGYPAASSVARALAYTPGDVILGELGFAHSDGVVPSVSALFDEHFVTKKPLVLGYDHSQMYLGRETPTTDPHFINIGQDLDAIAVALAPPGEFAVSARPESVGTASRVVLTRSESHGATGYQVFRNGQPLGVFTSGSREFRDNSVSAGSAYSYYVEASNASGQKTPSKTLQITAPHSSAPDNAAPGFPVSLSAFPRPWARNNQFNVAWNDPADPSGISKAWFKLGSAPTSPTDGAYLPLPQFNPFPISMTRQEGAQLIYVWLEDGRGNKNHLNAAFITLQLDVTKPTISITGQSPRTPISAVNNTITLSGPYADSLSGVASVIWQNTTSGSGAATLAGTPSSGTWTASSITLYPGANLIKVRATDNAGNEAFTSLTVNYLDTSNSGTLIVGIQPQGAVDAGAQWRLAGESVWRMAGVAANGVATGGREVEFKAVDGWITPLPATISVLANQIVTLPPSLGTYGSGTVNQAPDVPSSPYPANGDVNISRSGLTLRWSGGHPTGSPDFAVAFDTVNPPGFIAGYGAVPGRTYSLAAREPLLPATTYYWRVQGKVGEQRTDGPVWRFTTDYSYADLIPYEIAVDGNIQPGANVTVRVKVKNQGTFTSAVGCWLNLYLSQTPQGRERRISQFNTLVVPALAPGAEVELQQSVTLANLPAGQSFIDAWVDSAPYGINEQDYENNVRSLAIQYVDGQSPVVTSARLLIPFAKTGQSNSIVYSATDDVGIKTMDFYYSVNGGVNWIAIQEGYVPPVNVANGVFLPWTIPISLPLDTNLLVRVVARDASGNWGETNTIPYPILNGTAPTVAMLSPNGGEAWDMNSTQLIRWNVSSPTVITEMKLWFYFGDGNSLLVADIRTNTTGQYSWVLPNNLATANGRIRISLRDSAGNEIQDFSDAAFTIRDTSAPPPAPWTTPELLTLVPAQDVGSKDYGLPKLATDADGSAHLIYKYSNDTGALTAQRTIVQTIFYRKRTGTIWSVPAVAHMLTQIPDANGRSIYGIEDPQIAVDTNGRPHLLWARTFNPNGTSSDNNFREIFYTRFNGTSWDTPVNLSETLPGIEGRITQSYSPRIKIDSANTVHVLWKDGLTLNPDSSLTGLGNIYYRTNNSVLGWSGISQVTVAGSVREPSLYIDQSNRLHLSYMTNIGTILYQSLAGQGWTAPEIIPGTGPVFLNSQANAYPHLVWQYFDSAAGVNRVAYSRHGEGSWIPSEFVSSGVPNAGQSKVLVDSFGRAHVLMEGSEGAWELLFHKRREPLGWTSPIRLHLPSQDLAESHSDAALSLMNNEMHVVFAARTNGHLELFYNHASFASTNDIYPPTVAVSAPSPGTLASVGSSLNLQWSAIDDSPLSSISLHYTTNAGATWLQIATNLPNTGTNVWIVPDLAGFTAQVRVSATDALGNTGYGFSGNFSTVDVTPPSISISAPVPPAVLTGGSTTNIVWTATDNVGVARVHVDYSLDNGATWIAVATNLANTGTYPWTVPSIPTSTLLLRASAQDAAGFSATFTSLPLTIVRGNTPPLAPYSPSPLDGSAFILTQRPGFHWSSSDPDGDALTYQVRFGTNASPPLVLTTTTSSFNPPALRPQRIYFWQVLVSDGKATNTGPLWSFTTEAGTLPPTSLAEFKRQTNGHFEFRFNGLFGENQVVQASTNLFDWFTVATFGNSNAASVFLDSAATNLNRRFYRVLTP